MTYCHTCKTGIPDDDVELDEDGQPMYTTEAIPAPEVYATPVEKDDPRVSQGVRNVINPGLRAGWRIIALNYARGPRVGSRGQVLSISNSIALVMQDAENKHRVYAAWTDGKSTFAYVQEIKKSMVKVGSKDAIAYIKEHATNGN